MAFRLELSRVLAMIFFWLVCLMLLVSQLLRFYLGGWDCSSDLLVRFIRSAFLLTTWIVFKDLFCNIFSQFKEFELYWCAVLFFKMCSHIFQ